MNNQELSESHKLAAKVLYAACQILKDNDDGLPVRVIRDKIREIVPLDEYAKEEYEKSGAVRWEVFLGWRIFVAVKSGFLVKKNGLCYLTPEGKKDLALGETGFLIKTKAEYKKRKIAQREPSLKMVQNRKKTI